MRTTVDKLAPGQEGNVVALQGGRGMKARLESMGVRPGKTLRKVSSQLMAGPITILMDGRQMAMGRGIARRIEVETDIKE
jgi:ferrous iron transport protein A